MQAARHATEGEHHGARGRDGGERRYSSFATLGETTRLVTRGTAGHASHVPTASLKCRGFGRNRPDAGSVISCALWTVVGGEAGSIRRETNSCVRVFQPSAGTTSSTDGKIPGDFPYV